MFLLFWKNWNWLLFFSIQTPTLKPSIQIKINFSVALIFFHFNRHYSFTNICNTKTRQQCNIIFFLKKNQNNSVIKPQQVPVNPVSPTPSSTNNNNGGAMSTIDPRCVGYASRKRNAKQCQTWGNMKNNLVGNNCNYCKHES